jgi:primary-amine oxidase
LLFAGVARAATPHPLDPLTAGELVEIKGILERSGQFSADTSFVWIQLDEPPKEIVESFKPGSDYPRKASVAAVDFGKQKALQAIIDLRAKSIASLVDLKDLQPGIGSEDSERARAIVDDDPEIKAALIKRGLTIPGKVSASVRVLSVPVGHDRSLEQVNSRLLRMLFASDQTATNDFSPILDGFWVVVDLYAKKVIRLHDVSGAPAVKVPHDVFDVKVRGSLPAPQPLVTRQNKRNFTIDGNTVTWQNWQFRYGFNVREGLVLYQVAFNDAGRKRSVLYRGSVAEIATAYGDPAESWNWTEYFEGGEFGLGLLALNVKAGREVPANSVTLSPLLPDASTPRFGEPFNDRIYVYERDAGNLMYHRQGNLALHARATELVIGFAVSAGNYVYGFNWVFRQDGSFAVEVELGGEILTKFVTGNACEMCETVAKGPGPNGESETYRSSGNEQSGRRVHPALVGIHHQHWFNLRLDFDVDGPINAVMENNIERVDRDGKRERGAGDGRFFTVTRTVFGKAKDARRHMSEATARSWTIYNPASLKEGRGPSGYTLMPMENTVTTFGRAREGDPRPAFTFHHFWVTPYRHGQHYAAGVYPHQSKATSTDALPHYANDDSIYDKDIVVWYSLGQTHLVRPEDYPLISNMKISVVFRPDGFFERNPALGLGRLHKE